MASPILLPAAFNGMAQDFPRNNLPKGKAWNLLDYIPTILGAPAEERGGWSYASASLTGVDASATYVLAALEANFTAGSQVLVIDDNAKLIKIVGGTNTLITGTANKPVQNPFLHQQLVVIPSPDGTVAPQKYDGTTLAALSGGSVPNGQYGTVFVNRSVLGGDSTAKQRVFFSAAGDPTFWVTSGTSASFIDVSGPIKGFAALPSVLLVFGDKKTARIRGTTPPPGTDMALDDPIFQYGTIDARSIAVSGPFAAFANQQGVFLTDGTLKPEELTKACGISNYWKNLLAGYSASTWTVASGWFGTNVVVTVMNGTTLIDTIVFDTVLFNAFRVSNLKTITYAAAGSAGQELYAGSRAGPRLLQLSSMWTPGSSFKADADGTAVLGTYESPFYDISKVGSQRWRDAYPEYDLRDAASDNPTMTVAVCFSPEAGAAYTTLSPTMVETTAKTVVRLPIRKKARGLGFKVTRTNASSFARLYSFGVTVYPREGSRLDG